MKLTQKRLKELLHYDSETGIFIWIVQQGSRGKIGQIAGNANKTDGYRRIMIDSKNYKASRLAWLYMEGYFPENEIDHIDRIRDNDKWKNLRHVSNQCNVRNSSISKNNKSGIVGISWCNRDQKWKVQIMGFGKNICLGRFRSKLRAALVRLEAEIKYGFPNCNSTSSAYLYLREKGEI